MSRKIYHMVIEPSIYHYEIPDEESKKHRKEFLSSKQGDCPEGWKVVGVCGFHETTQKYHKKK